MRREAIVMLCVAALAGCLTGQPDNLGPSTPLDLPALCAADRPAVAHHAWGAPSVAEYAVFPCLSKTGVNSREPTIGISSTGTIFHYPAMTGNNFAPMGISVSEDNGTTWQIRIPNILGVPTHTVSLDPYFYLDPTTDRIWYEDLTTVNCSVMAISDDEGRTSITTLAGCLVTDHQTIATGPPVNTPTVGYPNMVYRCAIFVGPTATGAATHACQRSIDGGLTWLPPGQSAYTHLPYSLPGGCAGGNGHVKVDGTTGRVYLPRVHCGQPHLAWSDDEAMTWTVSQVSDLGGSDSGGLPAHDGAVAIDDAGTVYYFWIAADRLPYLAVSRDGGSTWENPLMVAAPGVNEASQPEIIAGGAGRLAFVYMGTESGPGAPFDGEYSLVSWNAYVAASWDADTPVEADGTGGPTFYTGTINDPVMDAFVVGTCGAVRCQGVQDFLDIRIDPWGAPWAALIDDCLGEGIACIEDPSEPFDTHREGAIGWLVGGPSLWGEGTRGPYP